MVGGTKFSQRVLGYLSNFWIDNSNNDSGCFYSCEAIKGKIFFESVFFGWGNLFFKSEFALNINSYFRGWILIDVYNSNMYLKFATLLTIIVELEMKHL